MKTRAYSVINFHSAVLAVGWRGTAGGELVRLRLGVQRERRGGGGGNVQPLVLCHKGVGCRTTPRGRSLPSPDVTSDLFVSACGRRSFPRPGKRIRGAELCVRLLLLFLRKWTLPEAPSHELHVASSTEVCEMPSA